MNASIQRTALCLMLGGQLTLQAGMLKPLTIEELSTNADVIVHGRVISKTVQRDPQGRIFTRVKLEVAEVWKGQIEPATFSVVHGGGTLDGKQARASFQVNYDVGEEVVAVLRLNQRGEGVTLGLIQGKFCVATDPSDGAKIVANGFHGRIPKAQKGQSPPENDPERLTLGELKQRLAGGRR